MCYVNHTSVCSCQQHLCGVISLHPSLCDLIPRCAGCCSSSRGSNGAVQFIECQKSCVIVFLSHFLFHSCLIPVSVLVYMAKDSLQAAEVQQEAALLLGRLSLSEACKGAIRGHFGIVTLINLLDRPGLDRNSKEVVVRTLSILAVDNEVNQDHIRCVVAEAMHCLFMLCCI